ncbi:hypothetical protein FB451DRAFT_1309748 [Mycena latifolia]|nr:hypothetical protein FB451DRAFT_1309748 [Mycena latifolia]
MSFIILNAYPGVGKMTVAHQLVSRVPSCKGFHNHLLIDVVAALYQRSDPEYQILRRVLRQAIFDSLIRQRRSGTQIANIIFTEAQSTSSPGPAVMNEYLIAARTLGIPIFSIILDCAADENARRLVSGKRGENDTKLTDIEILEAIRTTEEIFEYGEQATWETRVDTTSMTIEEVAEEVAGPIRAHLSTISSTK